MSSKVAEVKVKPPYKLAALDIDGTLYDNEGNISVAAVESAKAIAGKGTIEAFTDRDKREFKRKTISILRKKIEAVAAAAAAKTDVSIEDLYKIIDSVDDGKIENIRGALNQRGIKLDKICSLRDCMPNVAGNPLVLGSYYQKELRPFETTCCNELKQKLRDYIDDPIFRLNFRLNPAKAIGDLKNEIDKIAKMKKRDKEQACTANKGQLMVKRLAENEQNVQNGKEREFSEVYFLDDTARHLHWVNHVRWSGYFNGVPVSAVLAQANMEKNNPQYQSANLISQHQQQVEFQLKPVALEEGHANNPVYLRYLKVEDKALFLKHVPLEIINDKIGEREETLLHYVSGRGDLACVEELMKIKDIDFAAQNKEGKTALHYAAAAGHLEIVRSLIKKGIDVKAQDKSGKTALHYAASAGHLEVVRFLIEEGVDVKTQDRYDRTPSHCAAASGHIGVVQFLITKGADITAQDKNHKTPFDLLKSLLRIRIETLNALQRTLKLYDSEPKKLRKIPAALKESLLATLEYTEFGRKYCAYLAKDINFWENPAIASYKQRDLCNRYIGFCLDKLKSDLMELDTQKAALVNPEVSMVLRRSEMKKYTGPAAPKKLEAKENNSDQTLYVLQRMGVAENREPIVIPVAIISNTKGRVIPVREEKSYYNRAHIRPTIESMDAYKDPEVNFPDNPGGGVFYMPYSAYNDDETQYFFAVTKENGFQVQDITDEYFSPYYEPERFSAFREYSSVEIQEKRAIEIIQSIAATATRANEKVEIARQNKQFLAARKESILTVLNSDLVKDSKLAEEAKILVNTLSLNAQNSIKERRNMFLDLCLIAIELDRAYSKDLSENVLRLMAFEEEAKIRDMSIGLRSVQRASLNKGLSKKFIDRLKQDEEVADLFMAASTDEMPMHTLLELYLVLIESEQRGIKSGELTAFSFSEEVIELMSPKQDKIALAIISILRMAPQNGEQLMLLINQFLDKKITKDELLTHCSALYFNAQKSKAVELTVEVEGAIPGGKEVAQAEEVQKPDLASKHEVLNGENEREQQQLVASVVEDSAQDAKDPVKEAEDKIEEKEDAELIQKISQNLIDLSPEDFDGVLSHLERRADPEIRKTEEDQYLMTWQKVRKSKERCQQPESKNSDSNFNSELDKAMQAFYISARDPGFELETREDAFASANSLLKQKTNNAEDSFGESNKKIKSFQKKMESKGTIGRRALAAFKMIAGTIFSFSAAGKRLLEESRKEYNEACSAAKMQKPTTELLAVVKRMPNDFSLASAAGGSGSDSEDEEIRLRASEQEVAAVPPPVATQKSAVVSEKRASSPTPSLVDSHYTHFKSLQVEALDPNSSTKIQPSTAPTLVRRIDGNKVVQ